MARRPESAYGWEAGRMGIPPESATVEIDLAEKHDHQQGRAYLLPSTDDPRGHRPSSIRAATACRIALGTLR